MANKKAKVNASNQDGVGYLQTVRVPLVLEMNTRPGIFGLTRDVVFYNCYFESYKDPITQKEKLYCNKRPGYSQTIRPSGGNATGRGVYYWPLTNGTYSVFNSTIYSGIVALYTGMVTSTGRVSITTTTPDAPTPYLIVNDGQALYIIDASNNVIVLNNIAITTSSVAANSTITTATPHKLATGNKVVIRNHVGSTPSINDTLYTVTVTGANTFTIPVNVTVAGAGGTLGVFPVNLSSTIQHDGYLFCVTSAGRLYNCNYNDPTTWQVSSYVTAQMDESPAVGLGHQNNYVVVFKQRSIQFYYDAANAPGSPMSNVEQAMQQFGAFNGDSIQSIENTMYFVGNGGTGGQTVWSIDGTTNAKEIGNEAINRLITKEPNLATAYSNVFRVAGNYFYSLTLPSTAKTLVYNQNNKTWTVWTDTTGASSWPIIDTASGPNFLYAQHTTNGWLYLVSDLVYQDDSVDFPMILITPKLDLDTTKRKWFERFELVGSIPSVSVVAAIYYTDDDYQTYYLSRSFNYQNRYWTRSMGQARRRAFNLQFSGNAPLQFESIEMDIRIGDW
jgi:hypothetical protein